MEDKKIKKYRLILIALFSIILFSGCSINSEISIEDNLSVKEKHNITFNNSLADSYYSIDEYVKNYINYYKSAIDFKKYSYEIKENTDNTSSVQFTRLESDFCKGINSSLFSVYLYDNVLCTENDEYYIIKSEGDNKLNLPASEKKFDINDINIIIKVPVSAFENNADTVSGNTYTWKFDKYTPNSKSIYLKINKKELNDKVKALEKKKQNGKKIKNMFIYGFILITVLALIIAVLILYKKYKDNKIEY